MFAPGTVFLIPTLIVDGLTWTFYTERNQDSRPPPLRATSTLRTHKICTERMGIGQCLGEILNKNST